MRITWAIHSLSPGCSAAIDSSRSSRLKNSGQKISPCPGAYVDMHQLDRRQRNPSSSDDVGLGGGIVVVMTLDAGAPLDLAQLRLPSARHLSMSTLTRTPTCSGAASKITGTDGSAINAAVRATASACLHGSSSTSTPPGRSRCVFWPNS